jgi:hypothetical protein
MSVERRINLPDTVEFTAKVEQLKAAHRVDELLAALVASRLSPEAKASADAATIVEKVKREIDPAIVDLLSEEMRAS